MEVLTPRLYIGNLSYDASESDVFDHLSKIAAVKNVEVVREGGGNSKGFGFAEMQTLEGAQEVAKKLHDTDFMGRLMIVNGAKSLGERSSGGGRPDRPPREERSDRGSEFDYERGPRNPSYD
ncbi:MAG TPA: RNA-binding protein [Verrucomicrobia subdivision 6 bacterium]|jgi:RNA recognition motif-containing protein|nr:RNA-binding protein [Verrucomicrobia subdivision 6 bacterium]HCP06232.1 RNA-binding protein [Verrucomicrobiales bacterium]